MPRFPGLIYWVKSRRNEASVDGKISFLCQRRRSLPLASRQTTTGVSGDAYRRARAQPLGPFKHRQCCCLPRLLPFIPMAVRLAALVGAKSPPKLPRGVSSLALNSLRLNYQLFRGQNFSVARYFRQSHSRAEFSTSSLVELHL